LGDLAAVLAEAEQSFGERLKRVELVAGERVALHDREVELDLVEDDRTRRLRANACRRQPSAVPPYLRPPCFTRATTTNTRRAVRQTSSKPREDCESDTTPVSPFGGSDNPVAEAIRKGLIRPFLQPAEAPGMPDFEASMTAEEAYVLTREGAVALGVDKDAHS